MNHAIAKDYYQTPLTLAEIAEKHGISQQMVTWARKRIPMRHLEVEPPPVKDYSILKIAPEQLAYAEELLKRHGVRFEAPERCELIETFESSINQNKKTDE